MSQSYTAKDWPIFLQIGHFLQTYNIPEAWLMVCVILHPLTIGDAGCSSSPAKLWPQGAPGKKKHVFKPGNHTELIWFFRWIPRHRSWCELGIQGARMHLETWPCLVFYKNSAYVSRKENTKIMCTFFEKKISHAYSTKWRLFLKSF